MTDQLHDEYLAQLVEGKNPRDISNLLATEVEDREDLYDYLTANEPIIEFILQSEGRNYPEITVQDIRNRVLKLYRPYLDHIAESIIVHGQQSPHMQPLHSKELVALLA